MRDSNKVTDPGKDYKSTEKLIEWKKGLCQAKLKID